ncbi:MAG: hypothetical protein UR26_C0003G0066 [candidate division TM6 bacterium GW2011_GWF2_32_72]|nr:MAG: hypothetical protein UR26_C0003G0066 [candidate division TM6 bacterium GW2011_GWF2_32_72]
MKVISTKYFSLALLSTIQFYSHINALEMRSWLPFTGSQKTETINKESLVGENAIVEIENINGPINVKSWNKPKIVIEAIKKGPEENFDDVEVICTFKKDNAYIKTKKTTDKTKIIVEYNLMVPTKTNFRIISSENGPIKIQQVEGIINANTQNGNIEILDAKNTVLAQSKKGNIKIKTNKLIKSEQLLAETNYGNINVELPAKINADLVAKTMYGTITSDHLVKLKPEPMKINNPSWSLFKKNVQGEIGTGGSKVTMYTGNGHIKITQPFTKKK